MSAALSQTRPAMAASILVVDDDPYVRESLRAILEFAGYNVQEAADGKAALDVVEESPVDVLLLDLELPRVGGMDVLRRVIDAELGCAVVIISGRGSIRTAVDATRLGVVDFLEKPIDAEHLLTVVRAALEQANQRRWRQSFADTAARYGVIGVSRAMLHVHALIERAAAVPAKVLITGESGTGKELIARAIHACGRHANGPFVSVNCAAIPETLIESELFGYAKGAFTGAVTHRRGRFEQAHGGTLFLDEIGDMSLMTQSKVLRALEEGVVHHVGGEKPIPIQFRLIAATNRELSAEIERGNFRDDLYYRLNVIRIEVPPLRTRREDIAPLAEQLLQRASQLNGVSGKRLAPAALAQLTTYDWPGNVRELNNVLERMIVLSEAETIGAADVLRALDAPSALPGSAHSTGLREAREEFERAYIRATLRDHAGRIQDTAEALGINRSHLWKKLRTLGIAVDGA